MFHINFCKSRKFTIRHDKSKFCKNREWLCEKIIKNRFEVVLGFTRLKNKIMYNKMESYYLVRLKNIDMVKETIKTLFFIVKI